MSAYIVLPIVLRYLVLVCLPHLLMNLFGLAGCSLVWWNNLWILNGWLSLLNRLGLDLFSTRPFVVTTVNLNLDRSRSPGITCIVMVLLLGLRLGLYLHSSR